MNIKYLLILLLILFLILNYILKIKFNHNDKFNNLENKKINSNSIELNDKNKLEMNKKRINKYNLTIVRIRVHKLDFNWLEPYNKNSSYESIGTGFFINKEGYILTNLHVVNKGIKVYIQIPESGNKTYDSDIISVYPKLDVALLKIKNYNNEFYLEFANSDSVLKGELSLALGYPLGQNKLKITSGIISGIQDGDIQTDSPINKGNSGGPLLNKYNKVIGINYAGYDDAQNIGYSIPINYVKLILGDMYKTKLINFPVLCCVFNNTNNILLKLTKLCNEGYYVSNVLKNGTFDLANIKNGDIICSFDDKKIDNYGEIFIEKLNTKIHISNYLKYKKVNDIVNIILIRDISNNNFQNKNNIKLVNTKIKLLPNSYYKIRDYHFQYENIDYQILGGLVMMELTNNHLNSFEDKENTKLNKYNKIYNKLEKKIIITHILKGSKVSEDNIFKPPQILISINNIKVNTLKDVRNNLKKYLKQNDMKYFSFLTE